MEQGPPFGLTHHSCQSHSVLNLWISLVSQLQSPKHSEKTRPILAPVVPSTSTLAIFPSAIVCPSWELLCASRHYFGEVEATENTYRKQGLPAPTGKGQSTRNMAASKRVPLKDNVSVQLVHGPLCARLSDFRGILWHISTQKAAAILSKENL